MAADEKSATLSLGRRLEILLSQGREGIQVLRVDLDARTEVLAPEALRIPGAEILHARLEGTGQEDCLFPFSAWLPAAYESLDDQARGKFWKKVSPYIRQEAGLKSWLEGRDSPRWDDLLRSREEIHFERRLLWQTLWRMISLLMERKAGIILLEGLEKGDPDFFGFLEAGLEYPGPLPLIALLFTGTLAALNPRTQTHYRTFFDALERQDRIVHVLLEAPKRPLGKTAVLLNTTQGRKLPEVLLRRRLFLGMEGSFQIPAAQPAEVRELALRYKGMLELMGDRSNEALASLQAALAVQRQGGRSLWETLLLIALAHHRKNDRPQAEKYFQRAQRLEPRHPEQRVAEFSQALNLMIHESRWENPDVREEMFQEFRSLKENPDSPYTGMVYSTLSYYRALMARDGLEAAQKEALVQLEVFRNQGSLFQESKLLHMLGYLHQTTDPKKAVDYFDRGIQLRKKLGSVDGLIKAYNGVGYFCFSQGDHQKSLDYFQGALELLENTEDFIEISLTLFNVSLTYFMGGSFSAALEILQRILEVMDNLKIRSLPWHSRQKLYCLAGTASLYLGWKSLALDYWEKGRLGDQAQEALPAQNLLKARILDLTEEPHNPEKDLEEALVWSRQHYQGVFAGHIQLERIIIARRAGNAALVRERITEAESMIPSLPLDGQRLLFDHIKAGGSFEDFVPRRTLDPRLRSLSLNIVIQAKREASSFALTRSLGEMSFLKSFQEKVHRDRKEEENLKAAWDLFKKEFPLEGLAVLEGEKEQKVLYSRPQKLGREIGMTWSDLWPEGSRSGLRHWYSTKALTVAYPFKAASGKKTWCQLQLTPDRISPEEDLGALQLALAHLDTTLGLCRAQEELNRRITVDHLTGALTRAEFMRLAELERRRCLRYGKKGQVQGFALLYLDLDNFKTVNDTLGHPEGDRLLQIFTQVIKDCLRDLDLVGRIGGDEFLILLPETPATGAEVVGRRILNYFKEKKPFDKVIMGRKGSRLPAGKEPGCSIGAAVFDPGGADLLVDVVQRADQALYTSKQNGKGCFTLGKEL